MEENRRMFETFKMEKVGGQTTFSIPSRLSPPVPLGGRAAEVTIMTRFGSVLQT